jgi:hypothetical protein
MLRRPMLSRRTGEQNTNVDGGRCPSWCEGDHRERNGYTKHRRAIGDVATSSPTGPDTLKIQLIAQSRGPRYTVCPAARIAASRQVSGLEF